ncbi:MAG: hypothetical protein ACK4PH_05895 [Aquincola tertiaricarbonis]
MSWSQGFAEWTEGDSAYLSVAFTWLLDKAYSRALWYRALGYRVRAGGPALFLVKMQHELAEVAELGGEPPADAIARHNPLATIASRGCPVGCHFCIVPAMEGREFTLLPDFPVRPVLCDNNLSALPAEYQQHIIDRYRAMGVRLLDANSGFEPATFTPDVYERWRALVNEGRGPWRFAFDESAERADVHRVMRMLAAEPARRKKVYVLIGNEPFEDCMQRIQEVIDHGCEPHVQPVMKLNALTKTPWVRHNWTERRLRDVARWANGFVWRKAPFNEYDRALRSAKAGPNGRSALASACGGLFPEAA